MYERLRVKVKVEPCSTWRLTDFIACLYFIYAGKSYVCLQAR